MYMQFDGCNTKRGLHLIEVHIGGLRNFLSFKSSAITEKTHIIQSCKQPGHQNHTCYYPGFPVEFEPVKIIDHQAKNQYEECLENYKSPKTDRCHIPVQFMTPVF